MGISQKKDFMRKVLDEPLTKHRAILGHRIRNKDASFSIAQMNVFLDTLLEQSTDPLLFERERLKLDEAIEKGELTSEPYFETPETQLLWAAGLTHINKNLTDLAASWGLAPFPDDITKTKLWQQMTETPYAINELYNHLHYITQATQNPTTGIRWGKPGSWFYFAPEQNFINDDFVMSLAGGFEHTRAVLFHEIGHSQLTLKFPKRNREIREEMKALDDKKKANKGKLSKGDYKKLRMLSAEWNLRHSLYDKTENNVVNRYTANMGQILSQDYGYSLNHYYMTIGGLGYLFYMEEAGFGKDSFLNPTNDNVPQSQQEHKQAADVLKKYVEGNANPKSLDDLLVVPSELYDVLMKKLEGQKNNPYKKLFNEISQVVDFSFFKNNKLFKDTKEGWAELGIDTDRITKTSTRQGKTNINPSQHPHEDLKDLFNRCAALEHAQPQFKERHYGRDYLRKKSFDAADERNAIFESIWDDYLADLAEKLLEQEEDRIDEEMKQQDQNNGDSGDESDDQNGDSDDADGQDAQDGQSNSQGQSGGSSGGQGQSGGQPDPNQKPDPNQQQDAQDQNSDDQSGDSDDADGQDKNDQDGDGQDADKQDADEQNGGGNGDDQDQDSPDSQNGQEQDGSGGGQDDDPNNQDPENGEDGGAGNQDHLDEDSLADLSENNVGLDEGGEMPDVEMPPEEPTSADGQDGDGDGQDSDGQDADGQDGDGQDGQGKDGPDPQTLEQLRKDLEKALKEQQEAQDNDGDGDDADGQDADGQDGDGQSADGQSQSQSQSDSQSDDPSNQAGDEKGEKSLSEHAQESWSNYAQRIAQLAGPIMQVARLFSKIRDLQLEKAIRRSRNMSMLPENNELDRLNKAKHRDQKIKQLTGQQLEKKDFQKYYKDETHEMATTPDLVIMIDGSGSMTSGHNPNPMELALLTSIILYEAGKKAGMNVYVNIWGDAKPKVLARPGDSLQNVGQKMEQARQGLRSGTNLTPSFVSMTDMMAEQKMKSSAKAGYTHVLVISDGDISDIEPAHKAINKFLQTSKYSTVDFAVIKARTGSPAHQHMQQHSMHNRNVVSQLEALANALSSDNPLRNIKVAKGLDPNKLPMEIVAMMLEKIRSTNSFTAIPFRKKQQLMRRAHRQLKTGM